MQSSDSTSSACSDADRLQVPGVEHGNERPWAEHDFLRVSEEIYTELIEYTSDELWDTILTDYIVISDYDGEFIFEEEPIFEDSHNQLSLTVAEYDWLVSEVPAGLFWETVLSSIINIVDDGF